jgi:hypothetical protein
MTKGFYGIIVYDIIENAGFLILNGIYSNVDESGISKKGGIIHNEIAQKSKDQINGDLLIGKYNCRYIDSQLVQCKLEITTFNDVYYLKWTDNNRILFTGIGIKVNNQLSVAYIDR